LNSTTQLLSAITGLLENVTSLLKPLVGQLIHFLINLQLYYGTTAIIFNNMYKILGLLGGTTLGNLLNTLNSVAPITNVLNSLTPLVDSLKKLFCLADIKYEDN